MDDIHKEIKRDSIQRIYAIEEILNILESSDYIDPAEHLYDGIKLISREISSSTLHDFMWALESSTVIDIDGKVKQCIKLMKPIIRDSKIKSLGI
jgi:hypothetical protein